MCDSACDVSHDMKHFRAVFFYGKKQRPQFRQVIRMQGTCEPLGQGIRYEISRNVKAMAFAFQRSSKTCVNNLRIAYLVCF